MAQVIEPPSRAAGAIFSWIRDQDEVISRLLAAVREDRIPQAYLFHGPRGVGKTRTAIGLAQALNCTGSGIPCGECLPCRKIANLTHPDVRLLFPATRDEDSRPDEIAKRLEEYGADRYHLLEFARNASISIERIREWKGEAGMSLSEGRRRVFILTDAARMSEDAAQSALKLIEEPPPGTHLVLIAEEPSSLLPTIVSRCQLVRFRPLRRVSIEEVLTTQAGMDPASARLIAALSEGSLGRALVFKGETSIVKTRDAALDLLRVGASPGEIQEKVKQWSRSLDPNTARRNVELLLMWCHDVLAARYRLPDDQICNIDRKKEVAAQASTMSVLQIRTRIDALEEMLDSIDRNVNPSLALHEMLSRVAQVAGEGRRP
jgi:DNA polymerase III subunit delta'